MLNRQNEGKTKKEWRIFKVGANAMALILCCKTYRSHEREHTKTGNINYIRMSEVIISSFYIG